VTGQPTPDTDTARRRAVALVVVAVVAVLAGGLLGQQGLAAALLGAVVGFAASGRTASGVPPGGPTVVGHLAAFVVGVASGGLFFALRAGVFPVTALGEALAALLAVAALAGLAWVSGGRVPLAAAVLGFSALVATYGASFRLDPTAFPAEAPVVLATVVSAGAIGFAVATLADGPPWADGRGVARRQPSDHAPDAEGAPPADVASGTVTTVPPAPDAVPATLPPPPGGPADLPPPPRPFPEPKERP
jgi:hypothetical protein